MDELDTDTTDETLKLLSQIQNQMAKANEAVGLWQSFMTGVTKMTAPVLVKHLKETVQILKDQNKLLIDVSEKQCQLDERLRAIVDQMPKE